MIIGPPLLIGRRSYPEGTPPRTARRQSLLVGGSSPLPRPRARPPGSGRGGAAGPPEPALRGARLMFGSLSDRLGEVFRQFTGKGRLTKSDVEAGLREVRLALLEADVNFKVARAFVDR